LQKDLQESKACDGVRLTSLPKEKTFCREVDSRHDTRGVDAIRHKLSQFRTMHYAAIVRAFINPRQTCCRPLIAIRRHPAIGLLQFIGL